MSVWNVKMNARPTDKFIRPIYAYIERHSGTQLLAYLLACKHTYSCPIFIKFIALSKTRNFVFVFKFPNFIFVQHQNGSTNTLTAATTICFTPTRTPTNSIYYKLYLLIIIINKSMK